MRETQKTPRRIIGDQIHYRIKNKIAQAVYKKTGSWDFMQRWVDIVVQPFHDEITAGSNIASNIWDLNVNINLTKKI